MPEKTTEFIGFIRQLIDGVQDLQDATVVLTCPKDDREITLGSCTVQAKDMHCIVAEKRGRLIQAHAYLNGSKIEIIL